MTARETLLAEVERTVGALPESDRDAAAVHLAKLLAGQLDQAAAVERAAARALRLATADGDDALMEQVAALRAKLGEREALDKLGARLLAVLVELQATPRSQGKAAAGGTGRPSRLTRLRGGAA